MTGMKTLFKTEGEKAYFIIKELEPEYHQAAIDLYYIQYEDGFAKEFPTDTPNLERVYDNFKIHAEEMVLQTARAHPVQWEKPWKLI